MNRSRLSKKISNLKLLSKGEFEEDQAVRAQSVKEHIAMLEQLMKAPSPSVSNHLDELKRMRAKLASKDPSDFVINAITEIYFEDAWKRIEPVVIQVAKINKLYWSPDFLLATYPVGTYQGLVMADDQSFALLFDSNIYSMGLTIFHEIGNLVSVEQENHYLVHLVGDSKAILDNPNFDISTSWIARQIAESVINSGSIWADSNHLERASALPLPISDIMFRGFITFLLAHEYGHVAYRHHEKFRELKEEGADNRKLNEMRHKSEIEADAFGFTVMLNQIANLDSIFKNHSGNLDKQSVQAAFLFGVASFFYLIETKLKLIGMLKGLNAIKDRDRTGDPKQALNSILNISPTHPSPMKRLKMIEARFGSTGLKPFYSINKAIFEAAGDKIFDQFFFKEEDKVLERFRLSEDLINRYHLSTY